MVETIVVVYVIMVSLYILYNILTPILQSRQAQQDMMVPISPEQKESDMILVYSALNEAINKSLYVYLSRDITFSQKSKVGAFIRGHYRDLISFLLRPDVLFEDNGEDKSFLTYFINRVYTIYISETSPLIKSLLFKYYSGFSIDTYFTKTKKDIPSALPFITEYVTNFLWQRHNENEIAQMELYNRMQNTGENADKLTEWLKDYDMECVCKLSLNIYNISDSVQKNRFSQNTQTQRSNKEVSNEFSFKFNEQGK